MSKPKFVYVIYIASTTDKVFRALTDPKQSERYWFGYRVTSDWTVGAPFFLVKDGKAWDDGKVLEYDPPRRLSYTFHPTHDGLEGEAPSRVTFDLEEINSQVKLTMTHDEFEEGSQVFPKIQVGWPSILSSLKSMLETGKELPPFWHGDYDKKVSA
jgi:uncharacterized protein YndB with AHSA1/START domain